MKTAQLIHRIPILIVTILVVLLPSIRLYGIEKASLSTSKPISLKKISHLIKTAFGPNATAAIDIRKLKDGTPLCSVNTLTTLIPASVQKCVTTICAMTAFGQDQVFTTELYASTSPKSGIINGNIIIKGGGDPSFQVLNLG